MTPSENKEDLKTIDSTSKVKDTAKKDKKIKEPVKAPQWSL